MTMKDNESNGRPLVEGGQGRSAGDVTADAVGVAILLLLVASVLGVLTCLA